MIPGVVRPKPWEYQVDGEIGRFTFTTYDRVQEGEIVYDSAQELFPKRGGSEWYKTSGFKDVAYIYGATDLSYRKTGRLLKRVRYQEKGGTPVRTLRGQAEAEGTTLLQQIDHKAASILQHHGFTQEGQCQMSPERYQGYTPVTQPDERIAAAITHCTERLNVKGDLSENPMPYEAPESTVNISIDDVGVKRQKADREPHEQQGDTTERPPGQTPEPRKRKYAHTTVVHLEHNGQRYVLTGHGIKHVLSVVIALLLNSNLLRYRLQFFTDGYTILHDAIRWCFSWYPNLAILLDWYHLEEKCKLQLSLAMTGKVVRNEAIDNLLPLLWAGLVDQAIAYVNSLEPSHIKNPDAITKLIGYFERNRPHIPCYAVRKELGLRNSSQIGEKMNDLVVSERQKHNGMSWSRSGSGALASLTALARNNESAQWFQEGDLTFQLAA
jgi:hypothetical protein